MASQLIEAHKENAEIYAGDESVCKQKSQDLLDEIHMPRGILPLDGLVEVGYNRISGFVWLKQKSSKQHRFRSISKTVSYDTEVTAFVEERKMKRLTGVKSKELLIWVTISDIFVGESDSSKITFANPTGISRTFPVDAFQINEASK